MRNTIIYLLLILGLKITAPAQSMPYVEVQYGRPTWRMGNLSVKVGLDGYQRAFAFGVCLPRPVDPIQNDFGYEFGLQFEFRNLLFRRPIWIRRSVIGNRSNRNKKAPFLWAFFSNELSYMRLFPDIEGYVRSLENDLCIELSVGRNKLQAFGKSGLGLQYNWSDNRRIRGFDLNYVAALGLRILIHGKLQHF